MARLFGATLATGMPHATMEYGNMLDFLFNTGRALSTERLGKLLHQIPALSPEEREYVKAAFGRYASGGISKEEATKVIHGLAFNGADNLDAAEVEKVRLKILSFFV